MYERIIQSLREEQNSLQHFGIKDMHWGVRRYQNPDGSLTPEGREHYGYGPAREGDDEDSAPRSRYSDEYIRSRLNKNRDVRELSNKEIQDIVNRLNAENSLANAKRNNSRLNKILQALNNANGAFSTAKNTATNLYTIIDIINALQGKERSNSLLRKAITGSKEKDKDKDKN